MHLDPLLPKLVGVVLAILLLGMLLRLLRQPYVIGYLLAGVLLGPHGLSLLDDLESTQRLGAIGVVVLLFFVGMEVSLPRLAERWRVAVIGTLLQIGGSLVFVAILGGILDWPLGRGGRRVNQRDSHPAASHPWDGTPVGGSLNPGLLAALLLASGVGVA